jgi:hypothetical protein
MSWRVLRLATLEPAARGRTRFRTDAVLAATDAAATAPEWLPAAEHAEREAEECEKEDADRREEECHVTISL